MTAASNDIAYGIRIDYQRDTTLSEHAKNLLKDFYMLPEEKSPQEMYARASHAWSGGDPELAQRLYDAASKNYFVYASPLLSNAPDSSNKSNGLPISCFLTYISDSLISLINHTSETRWLAVKGGGVGGHWSDVRAVSDIAPGPIPFIHTMDADMVAYKQGKTRKGSYAAYLDISHPDIVEFVGLRVPTGDINRKALNLHHAVNITDDFMDAVVNNDNWNLVDPKTRDVRDTLPARQLWEQILETRYRTGEPYINFIDKANAALPEALKQKGLRIHGSNLCLAGDTLITINTGDEITNIPIEELSKRNDINDLLIKSYDTEERMFKWSRMETIACTGFTDELIEIESNGNIIRCTPEHLILTQNRGYIRAVDLVETDVLV